MSKSYLNPDLAKKIILIYEWHACMHHKRASIFKYGNKQWHGHTYIDYWGHFKGQPLTILSPTIIPCLYHSQLTLLDFLFYFFFNFK